MKKLLLSISAMFMALGMFAETNVTFDFDANSTTYFGIEGRSSGSGSSYVADGEFNADGVATVDGVTVTVSASEADAANRNRLWASAPVLRMYNGTLTVSATGHNVTKVVFNAPKFDVTVTAGTLDGKNWAADVAMSEVVFTVGSNTQIKTMTVTLDGELGTEPEPVVIDGTGEGTAESPYDVERALSLIENEKVSSNAVYVTGTITAIEEYSLEYGNATYLLGQGDKTIKVYRGKGYNGDAFTEEGQIKVDDVLVVCGKLVTSYGGQITTGSSIYSINGETAEPVEPEDPYTVVGDGSKENPYTVKDIQKLGIETSDGNKYWVKGIILGSAASNIKLNTKEKDVDTNLALGETADATSFIPVAIVGEARNTLGVKTNSNMIGKEVKVYGTLEKYFSTAGMKNVSEYWYEGMDAVENIEAAAAEAEYFNLQGQRVANPANGIYIRRQGATVTKVIVK